MIDLQKIKDISVSPNLIQFAEYLVQEKGDAQYPNYKKLDLMKVYSLVSNIWAFDFRAGITDGMPFCFSGTKIDEQYGFCVTGKCIEDCYTGKYVKPLFDESYRQVYLQKKIAYTSRHDDYMTDKIERHRHVETLLFPCSEDGETINYAVGISSFTDCSFDSADKPIFTTL